MSNLTENLNDDTRKVINAFLLADGYKVGHHKMYETGTTLVYSNFTPRSLKHAPKGTKYVVSFGQQMVFKQIHDAFNEGFFKRDKVEVCAEIKADLSAYLQTDYDVSHIEALHDLGYLPIKVKRLPEGTLVGVKIPVLTIVNTKDEFFWITNFLETVISNMLWKPMTSATIAHQYYKLLSSWQQNTDADRAWFPDWQGHDFSMRGLDSIDAAISSGLGHATSFLGSDSLPVIHGARKYYGAQGSAVGSVNATEHSVACSITSFNEDGTTNELEGIRKLLAKFPTGIFSMVSDTFDLWRMCTEYLPALKEQIMARDGKLVIRPDSGDPVDIVCGCEIKDYSEEVDDLEEAKYLAHEDLTDKVSDETPHGEHGDSNPQTIFKFGGKCYKLTLEIFWNRHDKQFYFIDEVKVKKCVEVVLTPEQKGVVELLWDVFGGEVNSEGFKVLDSHIGAIYGDSITLDRAEQICKRLAEKGFASTNIVLGVGSFTYQFNTRDTLGFAMKATYIKKGEVAQNLFKDPITDDGMKKSATGLLKVIKGENGEYKLIDKVSKEEEESGELKTFYVDGRFVDSTTFEEIRARLKSA